MSALPIRLPPSTSPCARTRPAGGCKMSKCCNSAAEPSTCRCAPPRNALPLTTTPLPATPRRHTKPLHPSNWPHIDLLVTGRSSRGKRRRDDVARVTVNPLGASTPRLPGELNRRRQEVWGAAADPSAPPSPMLPLLPVQATFRSRRIHRLPHALALLQIARRLQPPSPSLSNSEPVTVSRLIPTSPDRPRRVLDLHARRSRSNSHRSPPSTAPIYDEDRDLALRRLLHKLHDPRPAAEQPENNHYHFNP